MSETKVEVRGSEGTAEAFLYTPSNGSGPWPGVIFLTDIMGIREANLGMAKRIAEHGYVVLVPNIFYRVSKLPVVDFELKMDDERTMKRMGELRGGLSNAQMGPDGAAFADFLLAQPNVRGPKVGVAGYCFTGTMAIRTAAAAPDKIAAAASFHGGGLYTDRPDSPHLLLSRIKARLYFGHAIEDRGMPVEAIEKFEALLKTWLGKSQSETYAGARHGWTVPGRDIYNEAQAERQGKSVAVVFEDQQLTYQELNSRANQLAHALQSYGVGPEVLVGLCVERSLDMIVGMLGRKDAGGFFGPFASLAPRWAAVMLPPEDARLASAGEPELFAPQRSGWFRQGFTHINLAKCGDYTVRSALDAAWKHMAPRRLAARLK